MFGYILPERPHLYLKDLDLYRNFYCGICKSMGANFSQKARFTINYDITFLAILTHNYMGADVQYEKLKCITKPFNKTRKMVSKNPLTDKFGALNVILSYYKLVDDVEDDGSVKKKIARNMFSKSKKKADKILPTVSAIVEKNYEALRTLERAKCDSIDRTADCFGTMMQEIVKVIVGDEIDCNFENLCYNIGKWVYMIDALDDFEDDLKEKNYNPFIYAYQDVISFEQLLNKHIDELKFTFSSNLAKIAHSFENVKFAFNQDILKNVIYKGIPLMSRGILQGEKCNRNYLKF